MERTGSPPCLPDNIGLRRGETDVVTDYSYSRFGPIAVGSPRALPGLAELNMESSAGGSGRAQGMP